MASHLPSCFIAQGWDPISQQWLCSGIAYQFQCWLCWGNPGHPWFFSWDIGRTDDGQWYMELLCSGSLTSGGVQNGALIFQDMLLEVMRFEYRWDIHLMRSYSLPSDTYYKCLKKENAYHDLFS